MTRILTTGVGAVALCAAASTSAWGETQIPLADVPVTLGFSGFVRADYGNGNRYSRADGEDRLGFTKSLLLLSAKSEDIEAILDFGGTGLSQSQGGTDIGIKDAFIVVGTGRTTGFMFSAGAQPLLFGLKPNGYPSDRTLQANVDYGSDGAFAVSQQAGPSVIGTYKFTPDLSVRFGTFDLAESNTGNTTKATGGSKLGNNLFILLRGNNLGGTGLYGTVGAERIYVGVSGGPLGTQGGGPVGGPTVDASKNIFSVGVGFKQDIYDLSVEYVHLDAAITNTQDNERYIRAEATVNPIADWTFYADYSNGHELGVDNYRLGASWQFRRHLALTVEYSKDSFKSRNYVYSGGYNPLTGLGATFGNNMPMNIESVDARLTFTF